MNGAEQLAGLADNRIGNDRRQLTWRTFLFGYLRSRRRVHRRSAETNTHFIDWHHPWLFFLATGIMLLSSVDAFLTLQLLARGAMEINPVMAAVLGHGQFVFAVSKMLLTGAGILVLVFLSRFRLFNLMRTGVLLTYLFSVYACLVCYEFLLILRAL